MSALRIDLPALEEVVERLAAFDRGLAERLARTGATLRAVSEAWQGAAEAEYALAQQQWDRDLDELRGAVVQMHAAASTAHGNYHAAVSANAAMWGR